MNGRLRSLIFSFQTKLVVVITVVILLALFLAGSVFVVRARSEQRNHALERVAAASPAVYQQVVYELYYSDDPNEPIAGALDEVAKDQDVRILLIGPGGEVLHDTSDRLVGSNLSIPPSTFNDVARGFVSWEPPGDFPEHNLTFVSAASRVSTGPGRPAPYRIVLAVQTDTIAEAWRGVLPGLLLAALVAVPLSAAAGLVLSRQVAQPVRKLTEASEAMARGDFGQRVEVGRDDEIGRLARSFTSMSSRVGQRDAQMRALVANVSHDLKTPMTSITGYAQALADGTAESEDAARIGSVIRDEALHVNRLLEDLLYLGEIDANEIIAKREDVALPEIIARCVRRVDPAAAARNVEVEADVTPGLVAPNADPEKLERALTNVLDNAVKFTPDGGHVRLSAGRNGTGTVIEVLNTGSQIPAEDLPRLFDRFFRGDRARRSASGNGLGLAITREIVELHHGTVTAENLPDGVAVTIKLPS